MKSSLTNEFSDFSLTAIKTKVEHLLKNINQMDPRLPIALIILVPVISVLFVGQLFTPYDPTDTNVDQRFEGPSTDHLLGTDHLGRDIFSRVLLGGKSTLILGFGSVGLALILGIPIGITSGYVGGIVDEVLMRFMDVLLSFPTLILALLIMSMLGSSIVNAILGIGIVYTPKIARIIRSTTLSVVNEDFVKASKTLGESHWYIMYFEVLPNVTAPIVVEGTYRVGTAIIIGASLSFLGLGTQPPWPDWGYMVAIGREYILNNPLIIMGPGIALGLLIVGLNLLGDALRNILEPKI